jgi:hypothetical protein
MSTSGEQVLRCKFLAGYHLGQSRLGWLLMGLVGGWFAHKADPEQHWRLFLAGRLYDLLSLSLDAALM